MCCACHLIFKRARNKNHAAAAGQSASIALIIILGIAVHSIHWADEG